MKTLSSHGRGSNTNWGQREAGQKTKMENQVTEISKVGFEKAQHIPEGLEGHMHAQGYVHTQRVLISSL